MGMSTHFTQLSTPSVMRLVADIITHIDKVLGRLMKNLKDEQIHPNIILTADHGMTQLSEERVISIFDCVDKEKMEYTWATTSGFVNVNKENFDEVYRNLTQCSEHLTVYKTKDVPKIESFNIMSSRMPDLVLMSEPRWTITTSVQGNHGYSVTFDEMHPFLAFNGPIFKKGKTYPRMHAADIYPIMAHLLHIKPHPNNGTTQFAEQHLFI